MVMFPELLLFQRNIPLKIIPARDPKQRGGSKGVMHYNLDGDDFVDGDVDDDDVGDDDDDDEEEDEDEDDDDDDDGGDDDDDDDEEEDGNDDDDGDERKKMMWMWRRRKMIMLRRKTDPNDPKTGKHTLCEPANRNAHGHCTRDICMEIHGEKVVRVSHGHFRRDILFGHLQEKCRTGIPGPKMLCEPMQSTRAILYGNFEGKCQTP